MSNDLSSAKIESQYIMFTGTPGTRKSTQALSYPKPQYWLSWDGKMNSLLLPMRKWGINPKDIHYDDFTDWSAARNKLESFLASSPGQFEKQSLPYKTIIADSVTTCADCALRQTLDLKYGTTRQSGKEAGKRIAGIAVNEIEDYNAEAAALQELVSLTKRIHKEHKVNIILIAHVIQAEYKSVTNTNANMVRTIVTAGKRIAPKIPAYCEEVYYFFVKQGFSENEQEWSCRTNSSAEDFARTQLELPSVIKFNDNPMYDMFIKPSIDKINENR